MISLRLEGGERVARELRALSTRLSRQVQRDALKEGAEVIRARASSLAPREPGAPDLAENISVSNARPEDGAVAVAIGPTKNFFYGFFQEFGTSRHGAQPFLRPAFDGEGQRALKIISSSIWNALIRRGVGSGRGAGGGAGV